MSLLDTLEQTRIQNNGLALYRIGVGEPLFLMPYPHANSVVGDPGFDVFVEGFVGLGRQVFTFDPPSSGRSTRAAELSMAEMMRGSEALYEAFGLVAPIDVFGHCMGAWAALVWALEQPSRVRQLILANPGAGTDGFRRAEGAIWNRTHPSFWHLAARAALYTVLRSRAAEKLMLNAIERASFHDRSYFRAEKVSFRDWLTPARPRTWWGPTQLRRRLDHLHRLHEITAPALVLGSRHDVQQPVSIAIEIVEQLAEARLVVFEQSGHYPYIEEGEAFWSALFEYLNPTHYTIDRNSSSSHPVS